MASFASACLNSVREALDGDEAVRFDRLDLPLPEALAAGAHPVLALPSSSLVALAEEAFSRLAFRYRPGMVRELARVALDPGYGLNDRYVAGALLDNARISAQGAFPLCQDSGTACVYSWKGERVILDSDAGLSAEDALAEGARRAWVAHKLRNSQLAPMTEPGGSGLRESNTGDNSPLCAETFACGGTAWHFLFAAKGGGSSNKTALFQETKRLLEPERFSSFIDTAVRGLGVSACPPYHIAFVFGGQSPEECLLAAKLATLGALDALPRSASADGGPYRDAWAEELIMASAERAGWGAQFGGRFMARDARAIRLHRHAASFPVAVAVSCAAHRQAYARVDATGIYLERLADGADIERITAEERAAAAGRLAARVASLAGEPADEPLDPIPVDLAAGAASLSGLSAGDFVALSGPVVLARDAAHARLAALIAKGEPLPLWTRYPVYYAGPTDAPEGRRIGSLGPTTARRMDSYLEDLMSRGAFLVSIGKGERTQACRDACRRHGGLYFAAVGGAAALAASAYVASARVIDWEDLGMEAVRLVELRGLPALVAVDGSGCDFYEDIRA